MTTRVRNIVHYGSYFALMLCFLAVNTTDSFGQKKEYPERPIKIIVTTAAGGVGDLWVRAWSDEFSKMLKVPVVIVNEGGASGMTALIDAADAKPDGYTLVDITQSLVVGFAVSSKPPFDLFKDFVPMGGFGSFPTLIVVEQSSPFMTYEDMLDFARKNPGKLKCATSGVTMVSHFNLELLKQHTKVDIVLIPFKTGPQALTAALGKHVDLLTLPPQSAVSLLKAGRLRALLTTQKLKDFPNVPLFSDKGLKEAGMSSWIGMFAPAGIPKEIHQKLINTFEKIAKDPVLIERIERLNFTPDYQTPEELAMTLKKDYEKIKAVAKQAGISDAAR
jgi:tripartite-type tricarboxylate transporter receptor subunit TctC